MSTACAPHPLLARLLIAGCVLGLPVGLSARAPTPAALQDTAPDSGQDSEPQARPAPKTAPALADDENEAEAGSASDDASAASTSLDADVLVVGPGGLSLYPRWSKAFPPVAELSAGALLDVLRRTNAWSQVAVQQSGPRGWVFCEVQPVLADGRALQLPIAASPTTSGLVVKGFSPQHYALQQSADPQALAGLLSRPLGLERFEAFLAEDPAPPPTFGRWEAALAEAPGADGLAERDAAAAERARRAAGQDDPDADLDAPDDRRGSLIAELDAAKRGLLGRNALRGDLVASLGESGATALGQAVAARVLANTPLHPSRTLGEYVAFVGLRLADHTPAPPDARWVFAVLESEQPNASSTAGGFVFVTSGALEICDNEAQLAALLAHELAHVARGHALRSLDAAKHRIMLDAARNELTSALPEHSPAHQALLDDLTSACDALYERTQAPLSQAFEREADALAVQILAHAGYDPGEAVQLLVGLAQRSGETRHALSSHPPPAERAAALRELLDELQLPAGGSLNAARLDAQLGR